MAIGIGQGMRVPRMGIPRVNPNPKPPNAARPMKAAIANRVASRMPKPPGISGRKAVGGPGLNMKPGKTTSPQAQSLFQASQPGNTVAPAPATQSAPVDPFKSAAESAPTSGSPFQIPSYTPQAGEADPRDSSYWANLTKLMSSDQQAYSKLQAEQTFADSAYRQAQQEALQNRVVGERNLGEKLLGTGLEQSGYHDRADTEQTKAFLNSQARSALTKEQEDFGRETARAALREGYGVDAASLLAEAAGRYAEQQRAEAAKGPGEPNAVSTAAPAKKGGKGKGKGRGRGNGGTTAPRGGNQRKGRR